MARTSDIILVLVAILFPPASAAFLTGCSCDLFINIALTILGYIPGHVHAFFLVWRHAQAEERYGKDNYQYLGNATWEPLDPPPSYQRPVHSGATYGAV
ncbi:hypothetical protein JCM11251_002243 [Rhodosporidiobolus azoricus]